MFGYGSPEEMEREVTDIASQLYANPADREEVKRRFQDPVPLNNYEITCRRKDGTLFWVSMDARAVRDEDGGLLYYEGIVQDITARKRAEEALRESERKYRELVNNANSAIIRWKSDGAIAYFNEYAESAFGYSVDEALGKHVGILVPETESTGRDLMYTGPGHC